MLIEISNLKIRQFEEYGVNRIMVSMISVGVIAHFDHEPVPTKAELLRVARNHMLEIIAKTTAAIQTTLSPHSLLNAKFTKNS